jgi:hypothetical protein
MSSGLSLSTTKVFSSFTLIGTYLEGMRVLAGIKKLFALIEGLWWRINVRRWYVSKIAPKRYGDKLETKTELTALVAGAVAGRHDASGVTHGA